MTASTYPALRAGARIAAISPAGPIEDAASLSVGIERLEREGWVVDVVGPLASSLGPAFLAGTDRQRATALMTALQTYDAVIFTRGGYGTTRLLESQSMTRLLAQQRTTPLVGYSDATALLWAQVATNPLHVGGVHGPCLKTLGTYDVGSSADRLIDLLHGRPLTPLKVSHLCGPRTVVSGPVIAGNLSVATALIGTPWFPNLDGRIVVFEDVNEAPYRVDRMLTQWRQAGFLHGVKGCVLGRFSFAQDPTTSDSMRAVFIDRLADLKIPVYETSSIGHEGPCSAIAIGTTMTLGLRSLRQL